MNTRERSEVLAAAAPAFLGEVSADDLCALVRLELGDAEILDTFRPYGGGFSRARGRSPLLHIVSGNTPHAALQSLLRGLLVGARNYVKLPSAGLPEVADFLARLPAALREKVTCSRTLPEAWLEAAKAVIVFSSDETLREIHQRLRPEQVFIPHGHRVSFGVIFEDARWQSVEAAAQDVSLFDQQGCLSPHLLYIGNPAQLAEYARRLAAAMARFQQHTPRSPLPPEAAAAIRGAREEFKIRALSQPGVAVYESENSTAWTVIVDPSPEFRASVLNRVVFLKPLPEDLAAALEPVRPWLSTVGIFPFQPDARLEEIGVSRICPLGKMQFPPLHWHQDGSATLSQLVDWVDFESL